MFFEYYKGVGWDLDSTEIDVKDYKVFSKFITTYEELYKTNKKVVCFIDPPPYEWGHDTRPKWNFTNCEKIRKDVNDDKLILLLSRLDEQFLGLKRLWKPSNNSRKIISKSKT